MNGERKTQKLVGDAWQDTEFMLLKAGDVFRLFEPDGSLLIDSYTGSNGESLASSDAFIRNNTETIETNNFNERQG